jgi:alpha-tubulin suppressor-like RCC1 family protein
LAQVQPPAPRDAAAELAAHLDLIASVSLDDASDQCVPKVIDMLQGRVKLVGASAGHRHSLLLDEHGAVYSCGAGSGGALGHGDDQSQMLPCKITFFDDTNDGNNNNNSHPAVRIRQLSAGVDMSMAVSTTGDVYSWGKTDNGRIGLGMTIGKVNVPHLVPLAEHVKAVDVECGYVHSMILGVDGTVHVCGNVGVEGDWDGLQLDGNDDGRPRMIEGMNVWHRLAAPTDEPVVKAPPRKKYGKYEVKGRSKNI